MSLAIETHHILLVEDDPEDARIILRALERSDVQEKDTHVVENGMSALDYLYQRNQFSPETAPRPSLVVLDLNLPLVDGRSVLRELKLSADFRSIPVVVLTTSSHHDDIRTCYDMGVNSFVTKPHSHKEFVALIHDLERYWLRLVALPEEH